MVNPLSSNNINFGVQNVGVIDPPDIPRGSINQLTEPLATDETSFSNPGAVGISPDLSSTTSKNSLFSLKNLIIGGIVAAGTGLIIKQRHSIPVIKKFFGKPNSK